MASDSSNQPVLPNVPTRRPRREDGTGRLDRVRRALFHTLPGRLLVVGGAVKLVTWLLRVAAGVEIPALDVLGSLGSIGVIVGAIYFLWKLIARVQRRLLWRVRRKLILSYMFVGVVPVLLVVAFFLLVGLLLFLNVGAYMVVGSIRGVADNTLLLAQTMAIDLAPSGGTDSRELLERKRASLARQYPEASIAVVPTSPEPCAGAAADVGAALPGPEAERARATKQRPAVVTVGPWAHLAAPKVLPAWVSCTGFAGLLAVSAPASQGEGGIGLMIRAAGLPRDPTPAFAVVIDIPMDVTLKSRIREETSVKLGQVSEIITPVGGENVRPMPDAGGEAASLLRLAAGDTSAKRRYPWVAVLDWWDWTTGRRGGATANLEMNLGDIYEHVMLGRSGMLSWVFMVLLGVIGGLFFIIEAVALVMGLILARSITGSVHQLFAGTARVREGDFGHKIKISTRDQMGELAESFNSMTASIEDLLRQAEEKKRLEEELRIARVVQMSLLPHGDIVVKGLSITALCVPAREVGGDYYDLLPLDDGRLGVLIADVSGKGTSAAFYMAELKGVILSLCRIHRSPRQLLIEANRIIADHLDSRSFITMTYAVIDLQARTMTYARAGHTPLIHCTTNGSGPQVRVLAPDGLVVGLTLGDAGALFERLLKEETIPLVAGDLFMFFTDGITEAMNHASDCFGETRLGEILAQHGDLPSEVLRERILREIDAFVAGAPQHDDMTMILVKVDPVVARVGEPVLVMGPTATGPRTGGPVRTVVR